MSDDWVFQVSPKLGNGTLINVRGANATDFIHNLDVLRNCANAIVATIQALAEADKTSHAPTHDEAVANVAAGMGGAQDVTPPAPTPASSTVDGDPKYFCKHGRREPHASKPGDEKSWSGYFCPAGRNAPDRCAPVWNNQG